MIDFGLRVLLKVSLCLFAVNSYIGHISNPNLDIRFKIHATLSAEIEPALNRKALLLLDIWSSISKGEEIDQQDFRLVDFGLTRNDVKGLIKHFQTCKDCAADSAFLMAAQDEKNNDVLRLNSIYFPLLSENYDLEDELEPEYPTDNNLIDGGNVDDSSTLIFPVEQDDIVVLHDTKRWVQSGIRTSRRDH